MSWYSLLNRRAVRTVLRTLFRYLFGHRGQRRVQGLRLYYRLRIEMLLRASIAGPRVRRELKIHVDGARAFRRIERLIANARHTIIIQMFIWKDDMTGRRMAEMIVRAAKRGVVIDITKETMGDVFELEHDFLATQYEPAGPWHEFWHHPNIRIHLVNAYDHAKVFVFDEHTLIISGMNIADEYRYDWHDYMVELRGARFVEQYLMRAPSDSTNPVRLVTNSEDRLEIRPVLMDMLSRAKESIVVEQAYFSDPEVLELLAKKSHQGVSITVIVPERSDLHHYSNVQSLGYLLSAGKSPHMQLFMHPRMIHGKVTLIDLQEAFIGSANMMTSSLDHMGELNVYIRGRHTEAIRELREVLRQDILRSRALSGPLQLSWLTRWLAFLGL